MITHDTRSLIRASSEDVRQGRVVASDERLFDLLIVPTFRKGSFNSHSQRLDSAKGSDRSTHAPVSLKCLHRYPDSPPLNHETIQ